MRKKQIFMRRGSSYIFSLALIFSLSFLGCSDPKADAAKFQQLKIQDSLQSEISKTKLRIDSLQQMNDSLQKFFDSLGIQRVES